MTWLLDHIPAPVRAWQALAAASAEPQDVQTAQADALREAADELEGWGYGNACRMLRDRADRLAQGQPTPAERQDTGLRKPTPADGGTR